MYKTKSPLVTHSCVIFLLSQIIKKTGLEKCIFKNRNNKHQQHRPTKKLYSVVECKLTVKGYDRNKKFKKALTSKEL